MTNVPILTWEEGGQTHEALWRSEAKAPPPKRVVIADDTLKADAAYRLACEGTGLLWRGDFHNARQLLQAMARRADGKGRPQKKNAKAPSSAAEAFHLHRQAQAQRARTLGMLLISFDADYRIPLRRAPDVKDACSEVYGDASEPFVSSLRELQGLIGAHEWRKKGVEIAALDARIHPYYGVFSPVRGEYIDLLAQAPLPPGAERLAFDIGTGTGVLAAVLAKRGVAKVIATDQEARALACAQENVERLGLTRQIEIREADMFPEGRAPLVLCNPPWVPARPNSSIEHAIYDPDCRMLRAFLQGVPAHLEPNGEAWLILSDIAEHLGLRSRDDLLAIFATAGLTVVDRLDARPRHPKTMDANDPLHKARAAEVTSLWRLRLR